MSEKMTMITKKMCFDTRKKRFFAVGEKSV